MSDSRRVEQITLWLTKLALLTSGGRTPVTKQQIGLYAVTFAGEVPINAFSDESLSVIANGHKFFPAYSELKEELRGWAPEITAANPTGRRVTKLSGVP